MGEELFKPLSRNRIRWKSCVEAHNFSSGLALVRFPTETGSRRSSWGYISTIGEVIIPPRFDRATSFNGDLALVSENGQWSYIDRNGQLLMPVLRKGKHNRERG